MKKYSIVIPTYNQDKKLKTCIQSIIENTELFSNDSVEIIVVANGCSDEVKDYLSINTSFLKVLYFDNPIGYTKAVNEAIKISNGKYVILLNDDIELLPQKKNVWLNMLEEPFLKDESVGITGPGKLYSPTINKHFIVFFCAMIKRSLFDEFGLLDETFSPGGCEDIDFCARIQNAGYRIIRVPDENPEKMNFPINHSPESTVSSLSDWKQIFKQNVLKLANRHSYVAVVMPCRNDGRFLKRSISSIIDQSFNRNVIYFVDDASDRNLDNYFEIFKELKERYSERIITFNCECNIGQAAARNIALEAISRNDLVTHIAFCDADDFWKKNHLVDSIVEMEMRNCDFVYSDPICKKEDGVEVTPYGIPYLEKFNADILRENNYIYISSVVMSKRCLETSSRFDSRFNSLEDWDYWLNILDFGFKIEHIRDIHFEYTVKNNSAGSKSTIQIRELIKNKHKLVKLNLGCGEDIKSGYINCDLYPKRPEVRMCDTRFLPFGDNTVDEILASHLIEHFPFMNVGSVLKEWYRVLRPNGKLVLETPDAYNTYKLFLERPDMRVKLYGHIHAFPTEPGNAHLFLYTEDHLMWILSECGFRKIKRIAPFSNYVQDNPKELYLAVEAFK